MFLICLPLVARRRITTTPTKSPVLHWILNITCYTSISVCLWGTEGRTHAADEPQRAQNLLLGQQNLHDLIVGRGQTLTTHTQLHTHTLEAFGKRTCSPAAPVPWACPGTAGGPERRCSQETAAGRPEHSRGPEEHGGYFMTFILHSLINNIILNNLMYIIIIHIILRKMIWYIMK